jgi:hypothetical protein
MNSVLRNKINQGIPMNAYIIRIQPLFLIIHLGLNGRVTDLRSIKDSLNPEQKQVIENIQGINSYPLANSLVELLVSVPQMPNRPQKSDYIKTKTTARVKNAEVITGYGAGGTYKDDVQTTEASVSIDFDEPAYRKDFRIFEKDYAIWLEKYRIAQTVLQQVRNEDIETLKKIHKLRPELDLAQKFYDMIQFLKDAEYTAQKRHNEAKTEQKFETTSPRLESWYRKYARLTFTCAAVGIAGVCGLIYGPETIKPLATAATIGGSMGAVGTQVISANHVQYYENRTAAAMNNVELIRKFENLRFD